MYHYTDAIRCMKFEGVPFDDTFTDEQWLEACEMQVVVLSYMFTHETRALTFSRMLRKPLAIMEYKVNDIIRRS
jgi:hypothetical protein